MQIRKIHWGVVGAVLVWTSSAFGEPTLDPPIRALDPIVVVKDSQAEAHALTTSTQRQVATRFFEREVPLIARMAHPTLQVDTYDVSVDGDEVAVTLHYAPSGFLGRRYTTRIVYELDSSGISDSTVTKDTAMISAFTGLEILKDVAADMLRDAREAKENHNEEVSMASRALERALSMDVSGNTLHRLVLRLVWATSGTGNQF